MKEKIENKVNSQKYIFEKITCCICGHNNFEVLAEKDRYGLYMPVVICRECGLIQTNPRMTQNSYNEFYNIEYRKLYGGTKIPSSDFFKNQYVHGKAIFEYLENKLETKLTNLNVLEIGVGAGGILQYFKEKGNEVYGCDLGSEYVTFGKNVYGLNLHQGTIDDIEISCTPDIVIYSHVLEHILNPIDELVKIKSICGPNTYVYIELPGVRNLTNSYDLDFLKYLQNAHVYHFTLATLKSILGKAGYEFVCGDEIIRSIFKLSQQQYNPLLTNEYLNTIKFLRKMETYRYFPTPYNIKRITMKCITLSLKLTGLFGVA